MKVMIAKQHFNIVFLAGWDSGERLSFSSDGQGGMFRDNPEQGVHPAAVAAVCINLGDGQGIEIVGALRSDGTTAFSRAIVPEECGVVEGVLDSITDGEIPSVSERTISVAQRIRISTLLERVEWAVGQGDIEYLSPEEVASKELAIVALDNRHTSNGVQFLNHLDDEVVEEVANGVCRHSLSNGVLSVVLTDGAKIGEAECFADRKRDNFHACDAKRTATLTGGTYRIAIRRCAQGNDVSVKILGGTGWGGVLQEIENLLQMTSTTLFNKK
jgi:hypothetical protein